MKSMSTTIVIAVLLIGCNSNPTLDEVHENALLENQTFSVLSEERDFHLYLPDNPVSAPIVLLLHGNGGSSDQLLGLNGTNAPYKVWFDIARQENLILVVPNGTLGPDGRRGWNDCRNDARTNPVTDDVRYIGDLINVVRSTYGSSASAVFAVGTSNGGHMSMRLAAELPDMIQAIAFIVASKPVNSECAEPTIPTPVLVMNGTDDPVMPYNGGQIASNRGEVYSTAETVEYWKNRHQADAAPIVVEIPNSDSDDNSTVRRFSYVNGTGDSVVEHYEVVNGGHTEPSMVERYGNLFKLIVGNQNGDMEMATEIWEFFKSQQR